MSAEIELCVQQNLRLQVLCLLAGPHRPRRLLMTTGLAGEVREPRTVLHSRCLWSECKHVCFFLQLAASRGNSPNHDRLTLVSSAE